MYGAKTCRKEFARRLSIVIDEIAIEVNQSTMIEIRSPNKGAEKSIDASPMFQG